MTSITGKVTTSGLSGRWPAGLAPPAGLEPAPYGL